VPSSQAPRARLLNSASLQLAPLPASAGRAGLLPLLAALDRGRPRRRPARGSGQLGPRSTGGVAARRGAVPPDPLKPELRHPCLRTRLRVSRSSLRSFAAVASCLALAPALGLVPRPFRGLRVR
jgi:hypothetical protein